MRSRVLEVAEEELTAAARWYEDKREDLGLDLLRQFVDALIDIEKHPRRYPRLTDAEHAREIHRYRLARFPYFIGYEVLRDEIVVLAFAHVARRPRF